LYNISILFIFSFISNTPKVFNGFSYNFLLIIATLDKFYIDIGLLYTNALFHRPDLN